MIGDALRRNLGLTTYEAVMTELQPTDGDTRRVHKDHAPAAHHPQTTTERMLTMEKENIQTMIDGKGSRPAMVRTGARQ